MKKNRTYILELDEQQFQDAITAIETFHRVICGQVEELRNIDGPFRKLTDETLRELKREAFPELHPFASYGWDGGHPDKYLDRLQASTYAIYREMLHRRTVDDGYKDWSVYNGETLTTDKARLPKITIKHNEKNNEKN